METSLHFALIELTWDCVIFAIRNINGNISHSHIGKYSTFIDGAANASIGWNL